jgi:hypothetical protein
MGLVLQTMRDDNIAVIGGGMTYHGEYAQVNFHTPPDQMAAQESDSLAFAGELSSALQSDVSVRRERLAAWGSFDKMIEATGGDTDHVMPVCFECWLNL